MTRKQRKHLKKQQQPLSKKRRAELDQIALGLAIAFNSFIHPLDKYDQDVFIEDGKIGCISTRGGLISEPFNYCDNCFYKNCHKARRITLGKKGGLLWRLSDQDLLLSSNGRTELSEQNSEKITGLNIVCSVKAS